MLKIRLQRTGKRNAPTYRIVVAEHSAPIQGKFIEIIGTYIPTKNNRLLKIKADRINHWISVGAEPSQTVAHLCRSEGIKSTEKFIKARVMKPSNAEVKAAADAKQKAEDAKAAAEAAAQAKKEEAEAVAETTETKAETSEETKEEAPSA